MSEFGSIKNGQKPESAENLNNESLAQFGVASPTDAIAGKTNQVPQAEIQKNNQQDADGTGQLKAG